MSTIETSSTTPAPAPKYSTTMIIVGIGLLLLVLAGIGVGIYFAVRAASGGQNTGTGTGTGTGTPPGTGTSALGYEVRSATLSGANETPPVTTSASGRGGVVVNRTTREITGGVTFTGVDPTTAHIHQGSSGVPGPIIITLTVLDEFTAVIPANTFLTSDQYIAFLAGQLYFNVHTETFPDGIIRGQITETAVGGLSVLNGNQETPPVITAANGRGTIVVDSTSRVIVIALARFTGVATADAAHIHEAPIGTPGPVIVPLSLHTGVATALPNATLTTTQYNSYITGNLYFNIHSIAYPDGEIRGQIQVVT